MARTATPHGDPVRDGPSTALPRPPVRVMAVDDQAVFRRTARSLIAATDGFEQVGEACSGAEALDLAADLQPDLVLVDVRMPVMDGIETARRLREIVPEAVVVLISLESAEELPSSLESSGATAHVRKQDLSTHELHELWNAHRRRPARS